MFIDINRIGGKGLFLEDVADMDESLLIEEGSFFLEKLDYNVFLKREGNQVKAKGKISTTVSLRCVNCLEHYDLKIYSNFDIVLFPAKFIEGPNAALNPDEMEYIFYEGERIDVEKILMEQINLFVPYNPVCSSACRGICPHCGINLNYQKCKCDNAKREVNFVFDKLKR